MLSVIKSIVLQGLEGILVNVEVDISSGMPGWQIIGLPDIGVKESKERIRTAIKNCGIDLLSRKYIINLSPADIRKEGSFLDLPIAIGVLKAMGIIKIKELKNVVFIGELSLNGDLKSINGVLPMCIEALRNGIKKIIVPKNNAKEAAVVNGIEVIGVSSLKELICYLNNEILIKREFVNINQLFNKTDSFDIDFSDVKGQNGVKRALEIAVSGFHNILMIGSPGIGKTMMAKRIATILPNLSFEDALEVTKIYSIFGNTKDNYLITKRPFRIPHHTISKVTLIGGGRVPKPGEISLSHKGVLFLDELSEFDRNVLEALRGPIEDKKVLISRIQASFMYPSNFMLVASMNPCPCGYLGSSERKCKCTNFQINNYKSKISGPLLDRIDMQVEVPNIKYNSFSKCIQETSSQIRKRVNNARDIQIKRYKKYGIQTNSELDTKLINRFCKLDKVSKDLLNQFFERMNLSARTYFKILKVARTIADLDNMENICKEHILEAIQYRSLDEK